MHLAIIDDLQSAHDNVNAYLQEVNQSLDSQIKLVEELSQRIIFPRIFNTILKEIINFSGDLIIILDLGLELPVSIKEKSRRDYLIEREIIDEQIDGLVVALEAIRNPKIWPLLIVVATQYGHQDSIQNFLQAHIDASDRSDKIRLDFSSRGFGLSNQSYAGEIIQSAINKFERDFGDRFKQFLKEIASISHDDCQTRTAERILFSLLNFDVGSPISTLESKKQILRESLKSMGSQAGKPLSATGAWVFALAAYRRTNPQGNWQSKFNTDDLKNNFLYCNILPPQNLTTLRQSISIFFEMCCRLFESNNSISSGQEALEEVRLLEYQGLSFILNFPCQGGSNSLHGRLMALAKASLNGDSLEQNRHMTSLSIWRFWLTSTISDRTPLDQEGIFSPIWRINVLPEGEKTKVVFYE